jgi:hypothetical protein
MPALPCGEGGAGFRTPPLNGSSLCLKTKTHFRLLHSRTRFLPPLSYPSQHAGTLKEESREAPAVACLSHSGGNHFLGIVYAANEGSQSCRHRGIQDR